MITNVAFRKPSTRLAVGTAYDSEIADTEQRSYEPIHARMPLNAEMTTKVQLNFYRRNHTKAKWRTYNFTLSSNVLTDADVAFLEDWWTAPWKFVSIKEAAWSTYIEVVHKGGEFPLEYIDETIYLPEISFELIAARPI